MVKSTNGTKTITYAYDSNGNRVSKSDGTSTTYYINQYYDIENGTVKKHIFAGNEKVATIEGANTYYHHTDHLTGSNVETDQNGIGVELTDYYPFGQVRVDSKSGSYSNDYKFTGKELDVDTDLYYYGARYYDGKIGRFISADPESRDYPQKFLVDPQQLNSYSYARNNPITLLDPDGKSAKTFIQGLATGAIVAGVTAIAILSAPVTIPAAVLTTAAVAGIAATGYGTYANYKAYSNGDISKDQFDYNSGEMLGGLILPAKVGEVGEVKAPTVEQPKLLNPPIIRDPARMDNHVIPRHVDPNINLKASKFNEGVDLNQILNSATQQPMTKNNANGNYVRTFDTGQNVGIDKNTGQQTSTATVVTYPNNKINTMHPGKPNP